jgi:cellulose synthase/poly-beta-1,6-N-acetylglucosamine synthase-like glycosyltransferase
MSTQTWVLVYCASLALLVYVYIGYPILLFIAARVLRRKAVERGADWPRVSLIISAYNEAKVIGRKLRNSLALEYPRERLEILVVSDFSSDQTDDIVRSFSEHGVKLLRMSERSGKTAGLNAAVRQASGEVLVFSDANAEYDRHAIARLVRNLSDPEVGAVTGESRYRIEENDASTESENAYWRYELAIKKLESALGSVVGGDGAIYAIRKSLYRELDHADLSDFVNPLQIVQQGYRNVYEPEAVCYEGGAEDFRAEFRRKVRIVNRAWRASWKMRGLLNPLRYGLFAVQFLSHKVLRWLAPVFMFSLLVANIAIVERSTFYVVTLACQLLFYAAALAGWLLSRSGNSIFMMNVPYYFCSVNLASLVGMLQALRGRTYTTWTSSRR